MTAKQRLNQATSWIRTLFVSVLFKTVTRPLVPKWSTRQAPVPAVRPLPPHSKRTNGERGLASDRRRAGSSGSNPVLAHFRVKRVSSYAEGLGGLGNVAVAALDGGLDGFGFQTF